MELNFISPLIRARIQKAYTVCTAVFVKRRIYDLNYLKKFLLQYHFDVLFTMGRHPTLTHAERWVAQKLGPDDGGLL